MTATNRTAGEAPSRAVAGVATITTDQLKLSLDRCEPMSLVNVLPPEWVAKTSGERLPGSHWIPLDELEIKVPLLFAKDEPLVLYCGGPGCPLSRTAVEKLATMGFTNVRAYEGGLQEWRQAGHRVESALSRAYQGACQATGGAISGS